MSDETSEPKSNASTKDESPIVKPSAMLSKLIIGALVQVSSPDNSLRYLTCLIGADGTRTLITPLPTQKQLKKQNSTMVYDDLFYQDRPLVMRIIAQGHIFAFQSQVTAINYNGCKLLLSTFPKSIQSQQLRRDARVPCALSAQVEFNEHHFDAVVVNISNGGCQVNCGLSADNKNLLSAKDEVIFIDIRFNPENKSGPLAVKIMSAHKQDDSNISIGLAFSGPERLINDYLASLQLGDMTGLFL